MVANRFGDVVLVRLVASVLVRSFGMGWAIRLGLGLVIRLGVVNRNGLGVVIRLGLVWSLGFGSVGGCQSVSRFGSGAVAWVRFGWWLPVVSSCQAVRSW